MLSQEAKDYIENNKILLQQNNFQEFFDKRKWDLRCEISEFFLLDCDINFLEYMDHTPSCLFDNSKRLVNINIPNSVTVIRYGTFKSCKSLQSITIPDSVTYISNYAFKACESLQSIDIPDSVKEIGACTFYSCTSLQSIYIPDSVTEIGNSAFWGCASLKEIKLPKHLKEKIGKISNIGISPKNYSTKVIWY